MHFQKSSDPAGIDTGLAYVVWRRRGPRLIRCARLVGAVRRSCIPSRTASYLLPAAMVAVGLSRALVGGHWPADISTAVGFRLNFWRLADQLTPTSLSRRHPTRPMEASS